MNTFTLTLLDSAGTAEFDGLTQCIAADATGSFSILAGHAPMVAVLRYGLLRFCDGAGQWHYAALPGGVLRFADNHLQIATARYFAGDDRKILLDELASEMQREDSDIHAARLTLANIERTLIRRLGDLTGQGALSP
ncbi:MAG: F0F1 ATP synthase subunit epsilon [Rhizobium sp.]